MAVPRTEKKLVVLETLHPFLLRLRLVYGGDNH